jgi:hypothetical protein
MSDMHFLTSRFDAAGLLHCDDRLRRLAMLTVCQEMSGATVEEIRDILDALGLRPAVAKPVRGAAHAYSRSG